MSSQSRAQRSVGLISLAVLLAVAAIYRVLDAAEVRVVRYESLTQAIEAGAVARGWVPPFVPSGARDLIEVHDIDAEKQWIRFGLDSVAARNMVSAIGVRPLYHRGIVRPDPPPRWPGAWPSTLRRLEPAQRPWPELSFYRVPNVTRVRCAAVDWAGELVYAWSC